MSMEDLRIRMLNNRPQLVTDLRTFATVLKDLIQDGCPLFLDQSPAAHERIRWIRSMVRELRPRIDIEIVSGDVLGDCWMGLSLKAHLVAIELVANQVLAGQTDNPYCGTSYDSALHVLLSDFIDSVLQAPELAAA
jgi:hypothetical protein